jgi:hypothetical protein
MSTGRRKKKGAAPVRHPRKPIERHNMQPWVAAAVLVGVRNGLRVARSAATTVIDELDREIKSVDGSSRTVVHCGEKGHRLEVRHERGPSFEVATRVWRRSRPPPP